MPGASSAADSGGEFLRQKISSHQRDTGKLFCHTTLKVIPGSVRAVRKAVSATLIAAVQQPLLREGGRAELGFTKFSDFFKRLIQKQNV